MTLEKIWEQLIQGLQHTSTLEYIGVLAGIISVWFSRKENILVYPIGLINTTIYIYISLKGDLFGEASVNIYYTIVSLYGWALWSKGKKHHYRLLTITTSTLKEWIIQLCFFIAFYAIIFAALTYLKKEFAPDAIPWADAFASATAYTGMWLMAKKKVESWYWWMLTNIASIPLYFVKGYVFTTVQYIVLLIMAFSGLKEWIKRASRYNVVEKA